MGSTANRIFRCPYWEEINFEMVDDCRKTWYKMHLSKHLPECRGYILTPTRYYTVGMGLLMSTKNHLNMIAFLSQLSIL
jgi:hypothetical protein